MTKGKLYGTHHTAPFLTSQRHSSLPPCLHPSHPSSHTFTSPRRCSHLQLDRLPGPSANPNHGSSAESIHSISKPCCEPKQTNPTDLTPRSASLGDQATASTHLNMTPPPSSPPPPTTQQPPEASSGSNSDTPTDRPDPASPASTIRHAASPSIRPAAVTEVMADPNSESGNASASASAPAGSPESRKVSATGAGQQQQQQELGRGKPGRLDTVQQESSVSVRDRL